MSLQDVKIDDTDRAIIRELLNNGKATTSQLNKKLRVPITTIHNRIKKLKKNNVITNYTINLNYTLIGRPIMAYVGITINYSAGGKKIKQGGIAQQIRKIPDVQETTILTGGTDILIRVLTKNIDTLNQLVTDKLRNIKGIDKTQTMIVLQHI